MAGTPGKSGGARHGAGRKKKDPGAQPSGSAVTVSLEAQPHGGALKRANATPVEMEERDMLQLLQDVALGRVDATALQVRAAIAAVQYTHTKKGDGGKKEERQDAAKKVASRFAPSAPPKLVAAGGKKV
jgi:hypothetical protein